MVVMQTEKMMSNMSCFLRFLFSPFFRNWWAVLTGCASILAIYITPSQGFNLTGAMMMTMTFFVLSLVFLTLSVLSQGWQLFISRLEGLRVSSFDRNRDIPEGWVFILDGNIDLAIGTVVDVHKKTGEAEVPLALVRINSRNSTGRYQATPIGKMNPAHIKEHSAGGLKPVDLIVLTSVDLQRLREVANDL